MVFAKSAFFSIFKNRAFLTKHSIVNGSLKNWELISNLNQLMIKRTLFCSDHLGIDNFQRQRFLMTNITKDEKAEFFGRVADQFASPPTPTNIIFTEDLKLALNLAENDLEVDLVVKMTKKYNSQKSGHSHLTYIFGPPVLRLLHLFNKPHIAYQLFTDPELQQTGFFEQVSSATLVMDLLLENHLHDLLATVFSLTPPPKHPTSSNVDIPSVDGTPLPKPPSSQKSLTQPSSSRLIPSQHLPNKTAFNEAPLQFIPADHLTLLAASCFRQNSREGLEHMKHLLLREKKEASARTLVYAAMLAYNQEEEKVGLEILRKLPKNSKTTNTAAYTNAMVLLLGRAGEHAGAVSLLETTLGGSDVFQEVLDSLKAHTKDNLPLSKRIQTLNENLRNTGTLLPISFQSYLNSVIRNPKGVQNSFKKSRISRAGVDRRTNEYFPVSKSRPGLK